MRSAALARLLRGELRGRRLRTLLLFAFVVTLASATLIAGLEGQTRAEERWDAAFAEANGAHLAIDGQPAAVAAVAALPEVAAATHTYRRTEGELDALRDGAALTTAYVREMPATDLPPIARPLLRDGRWVATAPAGRSSSTGPSRSTRGSASATGLGSGRRTVPGSSSSSAAPST